MWQIVLLLGACLLPFFYTGANLDAQLVRARHAFWGWLLVTRPLWRLQVSDPACLLPRKPLYGAQAVRAELEEHGTLAPFRSAARRLGPTNEDDKTLKP